MLVVRLTLMQMHMSIAKRLTKLPSDVFAGFMMRALREEDDFSRNPARLEVRNALRDRNVTLLKEPGTAVVFDVAVNHYIKVLTNRKENIFQCPNCAQKFLRRGGIVGGRFRLERDYVSLFHKVMCPLCKEVVVDPVAHALRRRVRAPARVM